MAHDASKKDLAISPNRVFSDDWRQLEILRYELHHIRQAKQIMDDDGFTPQWNDLVYRAVCLSDSLEPGVSVSVRALQKRMVMVVRVNLGAPGREELRRVYGF